ncbi:hypothetical protein CR513_29725, partial [Mucuna pruriens]
MANSSRKDWSRLLEDALWAHRTTYQTPLGMSPDRIIFSSQVVQSGLLPSWKARETPAVIQILRKEFRVGQKVLLFNSWLKLIVGKLRSKWDRPFVITHVFPYGVVELKDENTNNTFQVNKHQIKLFHEGPILTMAKMESISLMELTLPDDSF